MVLYHSEEVLDGPLVLDLVAFDGSTEAELTEEILQLKVYG